MNYSMLQHKTNVFMKVVCLIHSFLNNVNHRPMSDFTRYTLLLLQLSQTCKETSIPPVAFKTEKKVTICKNKVL